MNDFTNIELSCGREERFDFDRDTLSFANETEWAYNLDPLTGRQVTQWKEPRPSYTLRCFVLVRTVKQFFLHARFCPDHVPESNLDIRRLIVEVLSRSPRARTRSSQPVIVPGFSGMRDFSVEYESELKASCGHRWQSYFQRGNWRMVFPCSRSHQEQVAKTLIAELARSIPVGVHLFQFPRIGINHAVLVYDVISKAGGYEFLAYDPNTPKEELLIWYDGRRRGFEMPGTSYFVGGQVNAYVIYRNWIY